MTGEGQAVDWPAFSRTMERLVAIGEVQCAPLLQIVEPVDRLLGRLVARETSPLSDRPQDYVACILAVRAFRLTVPSIHLALSGYPDACPNLYRTQWEICMRLLDMAVSPIEGAMGYLLQGAIEELSTARAEQEDPGDGDVPMDRVSSEVGRLTLRYSELEEHARSRGLDPEAVRRRHGNLNYRDVCRRFGIERSYLVNYAFSSGFVHEKNWATSAFVSSPLEGERLFELGPLPEARPEAMADALRLALMALSVAAGIVGDEALATEAEAITRGLDSRTLSAIERLQRGGRAAGVT